MKKMLALRDSRQPFRVHVLGIQAVAGARVGEKLPPELVDAHAFRHTSPEAVNALHDRCDPGGQLVWRTLWLAGGLGGWGHAVVNRIIGSATAPTKRYAGLCMTDVTEDPCGVQATQETRPIALL